MYFDVEYQLDKRIRIDQRGFPYNTNDLTSIPGGQNNNPQAGGSTFYGNVKPAILTDPGDLASGQAIGGVANEWRPLRTCAADAPLTRHRASTTTAPRWAPTAPRTSPPSATSSPSRSASAPTAASRSSRTTTWKPI
jgi:hypothetical protein